MFSQDNLLLLFLYRIGTRYFTVNGPWVLKQWQRVLLNLE